MECRLGSCHVPQGDVNRPVTLASQRRAFQPNYVVDRRMDQANPTGVGKSATQRLKSCDKRAKMNEGRPIFSGRP